jgi:alcohol dehydrogenase class IV
LNSVVVRISVPKTLFGVGALNGIGDLLKELNAGKVVVVTDKGIVSTGIIDRVQSLLDHAGVMADVFDKCGLEAPVSIIQELSRMTVEGKYDLLVGLGGGSVMDTTKAACHLATNPDLTAQDLIAMKPIGKSLKKLLIPTTAGTGSEWSLAAVITNDTVEDRSYPFFGEMNLPDAVIIDPELTLTLPQSITAHTGMDALTHAIEAFTCRGANIVTDMFAAKAMELIFSSLREAYSKGVSAPEARYNLSFAASCAMFAGSVGGVGLSHFMNTALSKKAHISHGLAVGLMLPYVMEYNMIARPEKFAEIARLAGEKTEGLSEADAALKSIEAVRRLMTDLGVPQRLGEVGIGEGDIEFMVDELLTYQSFVIQLMNPRDVNRADALNIYRKAL